MLYICTRYLTIRMSCSLQEKLCFSQQKFSGQLIRESSQHADLEDHIDDLIYRFRNKALQDTIFRVGQDLTRKLSYDDRLRSVFDSAVFYLFKHTETASQNDSALLTRSSRAKRSTSFLLLSAEATFLFNGEISWEHTDAFIYRLIDSMPIVIGRCSDGTTRKNISWRQGFPEWNLEI